MMIESLGRDVRFALRSLLRSPFYASVAVVTLALGIGANTAVFSVVRGVILAPLPYPESERLVSLRMTDEEDGDLEVPWSVQSLRDVTEESISFESIVGYSWEQTTLTGMGDPELIYAVATTGRILETFGVSPALGRDLQAGEAVPDGPHVVVISHEFWQERLGGDPSVLGRTLQLSGQSFEVVGVAPEGFEYPQDAQIWTPGQWNEEAFSRGHHFLRVVGRLAAGDRLANAQAELSGIASRLEDAYPETNRSRGVHLVSLLEATVGDVRLGLALLMGAVGMVLLIACVNVANLLLVRGSVRTGEIAVRGTLGAGRPALVRMLVAESLVLAVGGAALGLLLANWGVHGLRAWSPGGIPRLGDVVLDGPVLLFAGGLALGVTLLFGLVPAMRVTRFSISDVIREGRDRDVRIGDRRFARSGLLAAEMALSLMLLLGAGLLLRSFVQTRSVDLGFDAENVQQFTVTLPAAEYGPEEAVAFFGTLEERLASVPGAEAVGMINGSPLGRRHTTVGFDIVGRAAGSLGQQQNLLFRVATTGYFQGLRIPLLRGRGFEDRDRAETPRVVLISQAAAKRFWPDADPIGQQVSFDEDEPPWTIIGVVGDVRSLNVTKEPQPEAYFPHSQQSRNTMTIVVREGVGSADLRSVFRQEVRALDPGLAVYWVEMLEDRIATLMAPQRFYLSLLGLFAALAIVLASVGLYGVVAYLVSRRTREIGIRVALGASNRNLFQLVAGQGVRPAVTGIVIGLLGALAIGRLLEGFLYQVDPWDPFTFTAAAVLLFGIAVLATLLPVRSAMRVSPTEAMRAE